MLDRVSRAVLAHETVDCLLLSHSLFLKAGKGAGASGGYTISPEVTYVYTEWACAKPKQYGFGTEPPT